MSGTTDDDDMFAQLRAISSPEARQESVGADVVDSIRGELRPFVLKAIAHTWRVILEWRRKYPQKIFERSGKNEVREMATKNVQQYFRQEPELFFVNLSEVICIMYDAAMLTAFRAHPDISAGALPVLEQFGLGTDRTGGFGFSSELSKACPPPKTADTVQFFISRRMQISARIADTASPFHNHVLPELSPASFIVSGLALLAYDETKGDKPRMKRMLRNTHRFLTQWANLSPGAFVAVRMSLRDETTNLLNRGLFVVADRGLPSERLSLSNTGKNVIARVVKAISPEMTAYRRGCPALAVQTDDGNPVTGILDWAFELFEAHAAKMRTY